MVPCRGTFQVRIDHDDRIEDVVDIHLGSGMVASARGRGGAVEIEDKVDQKMRGARSRGKDVLIDIRFLSGHARIPVS
jgi:hypothetical protein